VERGNDGPEKAKETRQQHNENISALPAYLPAQNLFFFINLQRRFLRMTCVSSDMMIGDVNAAASAAAAAAAAAARAVVVAVAEQPAAAVADLKFCRQFGGSGNKKKKQ
jgi:hypothetical protein